MIFGNEEGHLLEGKQVFEHVTTYFELLINTIKNKLNFLTGGMAESLGLIETGRQKVNLYKKLGKKFMEIYNHSYSTKSLEELEGGIMDRIVRHNKTCELNNNLDDILEPEDIIGNMYLFQFAGSDTTIHTTTQTLCYLAEHRVLQEKIRRQSNSFLLGKKSSEVSFSTYDESKDFNLTMKEIMRMFQPVPRVTMRKVVKTFKMKDLVIKKGTLISVSIRGNHFNENNYPNPEEFNPERFSEEGKKNRHRLADIPFYYGQRNCVG